MLRRLRRSFRLDFIKNLRRKSRNVKLNNMGLSIETNKNAFEVNFILGLESTHTDMGVSGGLFLGGQAISFPIFAKLGDLKNLMCKYSRIKGMQLT